MRRVLAVVVVLGAGAARADEFGDPIEAMHPEWKERVARTVDASGKRMNEETRRYDTDGRLVVQVYKDDRSIVDTYTWTAGRLASHEQRVDGRRSVRRDLAYKLDSSGRIASREIVDPHDPTIHLRETWVWSPDGSRAVERLHVDVTGKAYADGRETYNAAGLLASDCSAHGGCSLYEYDDRGHVRRVREQYGAEHYYRVYERDYDAAGRVTREKIGGIETTFAYARGELVSSERRDGGVLKSRTTYSYARR